MDFNSVTPTQGCEFGEDELAAEFEMELKALMGNCQGSRKNEGWVCRICGKGFASAKSLGGHIRVHKNRAIFSPECSRKSGLKEPAGEEKLSCSFCRKTFLSPKQLYGHLRLHPKRPCRGVIPPDTFSTDTAPLSTIDSDMEESWTPSPSPTVDLLTCLGDLKWPKKPRTSNHSTAAVDSGLTRDEMGAINGLMLLATGDARYRFLNYSGNKRKMPSENQLLSFKTPTQKKRRKVSTPDPSPIPRTYDCTFCNKSYCTPQALGGHRSSAHKPVPILEFGTPHKQDNPVATPLAVTITHTCRFCNKQFSSGHALGGHMRHHKHWPTPGSAAQIGSSGFANTAKEAVQFGFDLNELPEIDAPSFGKS